MNKMEWAGIPFEKRYSQSASAPKSLVAAMRKIDDLLDLKFYMPTECWHVVRYPEGRNRGFVRCWECNDNPGKQKELGMWIIEALHKGDTQKRDILKEIDDSNAQLKASIDREVEAQAKDFAADMRKPLQALVDGNPETHYNYSVGLPKEEKRDGFIVRDTRCISTNS